MAKFLNTSGTNYHLEELIKGARDRLVLISPFLKLNDRIKELLEDKNRLKIDVRIIYGKTELAPAEVEWLRGMQYVRTSFCKNLHAKCYLNEERCIVTSLNLYEFSMVNNNEMGILIERTGDSDLYKDVYDEAQRIVRISDEVRISMERVEPSSVQAGSSEAEEPSSDDHYDKLTTGKLAAKFGIQTKDLFSKMETLGLVEVKGGKHYLTAEGKALGGEWRPGYGGGYLIWPADMNMPA